MPFETLRHLAFAGIAPVMARMEQLAAYTEVVLDDRIVGKFLFAGVFAALIVWLLLIPAHRLGQAEEVPPWWKNVRVWGIFVAATQMLVYLLWE